MINFKKMDEKDFIFINQSPGNKDEKRFSDFLKNRKKKTREKKSKKKTNATELQ